MPDNQTTQEIAAASGVVLGASIRSVGDGIEIHLDKKAGPACVLHWGVVHAGGGSWEVPPDSAWPAGSKPATRAVDTPVSDGGVDIRLDARWRFAFLDFVFFDPKRSTWDSNQGRNYRLVLPTPRALDRAPAMLAQSMAGDGESVFEAHYTLDDGYELAVAVRSSERGVTVAMVTDIRPPLSLYWGVAANRREWRLPESALRPADTHQATDQAVETAFREEGGLRALRISMPSAKAPPMLGFVLRQPGLDRWWKDRGRNFFVPLAAEEATPAFQDPGLCAVADEIIDKETSSGSWTLMHRFELAWALLDRVPSDGVPGLALIFVWLRFSAIRQLDWQRNFNTKPRELSHAQDRLTAKLGDRAARADENTRPWLRMIATGSGCATGFSRSCTATT
jgi:alpha-glucan,water dikinase